MREFSLGVPVHNNKDLLLPFIMEAEKAFSGMDYEIIFIDDASTDSSFGQLTELKKNFPRIKIIKLRKNCGQSMAVMAGIFYTQTRYGAIVDIDMYGHLNIVRSLLGLLDDPGVELVKVSRRRIKRPLLRNACSAVMAFIFNLGSSRKIRDIGSSVYIAKDTFFKKMADRKYSRLWRFLPFLVTRLKPGIKEVWIDGVCQEHGSSYSPLKLFMLGLLIISVKVLCLFGLENILPEAKIDIEKTVE